MKIKQMLSLASGVVLLVAAGVLARLEFTSLAVKNELSGKELKLVADVDPGSPAPPVDETPRALSVSSRFSAVASSGRQSIASHDAARPGFPASHYLLKTIDAVVNLAGESPTEIDQSHTSWTPLSRNTPGGALTFSGRQAVVVATQPVPDASNPSLSIEVTPQAESPLTSPREINPSYQTHTTMRRGFTYEEELFRTKWGWTAEDQVRIALREETSD